MIKLFPVGKAVVLKVAMPLVSVPVPTAVPLSRKVTVPAVRGEVSLATSAVRVMLAPKVGFDGEAMRVVVVESGEMVMAMVGEEDAARLVVAA